MQVSSNGTETLEKHLDESQISQSPHPFEENQPEHDVSALNTYEAELDSRIDPEKKARIEDTVLNSEVSSDLNLS